jgi:hypothetical protein
MRSGRALLAILFVCMTSAGVAQSTLPNPDQLWIVAARAVRQASTQDPLELTLNSGTRITVPPQDVHDYATTFVRAAMSRQASQAVALSLLFALQIKATTPVGKSAMDVTLASGAVVRVASGDLNDVRLLFLRTALTEAQFAKASVAGSPDSTLPSDGAVATIRTKCAADWPDDFRMRAHCQEQQDAAFATLRRRAMSGSSEDRTIRRKCATDWPDDFRMRNYCEEQQLKGLASIR